jgi:hypothetical protein
MELANRLASAALHVQGQAQVIMDEGVVRSQADGFLVLADRLVELAFLVEGGAKVDVQPPRAWVRGLDSPPECFGIDADRALPARTGPE